MHFIKKSYSEQGENKIATGEKVTKTILDWFHDEICNMHFRTWDVPKKKKKREMET